MVQSGCCGLTSRSEAHEQLEGRLEELETKDNQHDTTRTAAEAALSAMQSRLDESLNEQVSDPTDVTSRRNLTGRHDWKQI